MLGLKRRVTVAKKYSVQNGYIGLTDGYVTGLAVAVDRSIYVHSLSSIQRDGDTTEIACLASVVACCFCRIAASSGTRSQTIMSPIGFA